MKVLKALFFYLLVKLPPFAARLCLRGRLRRYDGRVMDPKAQAIGSFIAAARKPGPPDLGEMRRGYRMGARLFDSPGPKLALVEDRTIRVRTGELSVRLFDRRMETDLRPMLLYFHGGGGTIGDLDTHHGIAARLAHAADMRVVSVAYRLAPEHPFPAAVDDALAVHDWLLAHGAELGADVTRMAVGGDSAGGGLTAVLMHDLGRAGEPRPKAQVLIYPSVDARRSNPAFEDLKDAYVLPQRLIKWFTDCYIPQGADLTDPRLSPTLSDHLGGQPPAFILTCGFDPLRPDAELYARKLKAEGVEVTLREWRGQIHGFINFARVIRDVDAAAAEIGAWLRERV